MSKRACERAEGMGNYCYNEEIRFKLRPKATMSISQVHWRIDGFINETVYTSHQPLKRGLVQKESGVTTSLCFWERSPADVSLPEARQGRACQHTGMSRACICVLLMGHEIVMLSDPLTCGDAFVSGLRIVVWCLQGRRPARCAVDECSYHDYQRVDFQPNAKGTHPCFERGAK